MATNLVNTAPGVWHGTDQLAEPGDLDRFLAAHDVAPAAVGGPAGCSVADLAAVGVLRDRLRALLDAAEGGAGAEEAVARQAGELAARVGTGPVLERDGAGRWQWTTCSRAGADLADELALVTGTGLLGVLRTLSVDRFRACASDTCSGVFVDVSRSGRRRYCMPDLCGNRANVANHRARRRREG